MNKTILVCDDDQGILDMIVLVLKTQGYRAIGEINSPNLFNMIEKEHPGLVIIDLRMPLMSGDEIIKVLRRSPNTQNLPIIVTSANINGKEMAADAGANHFISKPFDIFNLIDKVEQYYAQAC
jgi:CheY-like chemotaxis protein